jgi:hypothetical protein
VVCFAAHCDPVCVVGVQPAERGTFVGVPGINERIRESSRSNCWLPGSDSGHAAEENHECDVFAHDQMIARVR